MSRENERNVNPPHNRIHHESPEVTKAKAFIYHRNAGSMEDYYKMYPMDRPPSREVRGRER